MAGPRESRLENVLSSDCRSGKVHGRANRKSVGNASDSRQTVGRERYVGRERAFPSGLSPTDMIGRQYSFPTDYLTRLPWTFSDRLPDRLIFPNQHTVGPHGPFPDDGQSSVSPHIATFHFTIRTSIKLHNSQQ